LPRWVEGIAAMADATTFQPCVIPVLRSFDAQRAAEFYQGFLGFVQDWTHRFGDDFPLYQQLSLRSAAGLACVLHVSEHHGDACPGSTVRIAWPQLEAFQQSLLAKNYRYAKPGLERMPWGMLEMRIADPFGNHLVFFEELPDAPGSAGG